ncbi:GntR family transcriptional regulator [Aureimonas pseudogalii]|uniref:DNA-binding GntR family transcriptional regulator n=1 Tax=Aureimonas pseudogalii TaxID=1744844 RepID=A0A7W6EH97_9HYPH|nr:GntR family transcriptional regulator [Aureimonas pseudogalii]MBB3998069.1 DNA-binding GntR family transcriptional regulator [Aureimonas pseudogalii]
MSKPRTLFKDAFNRALDLLAQEKALPSESELATRLDVSRTTVRAVLGRMQDIGLIRWENRTKLVLRMPGASDAYPPDETDSLDAIIERGFMRRILAGGAEPGDMIGEADLARDLGVGVSAVREFLIRFSRFGLIEKRRNSQWVLKGFTRDFALELNDVREMFELRSVQRFVELGAAHPAWEALDAIEAEHHAMLAAIDRRYTTFSELDERFHRLIHQASANRFVIDFYDVIAMIFHYHYQWNKTGERERNRAALEEHLRYIAALRSRDAMEAEFYCRRHLRSARETLLQSIPGGAADAADPPAT